VPWEVLALRQLVRALLLVEVGLIRRVTDVNERELDVSNSKTKWQGSKDGSVSKRNNRLI
jgi:hypothetical protein